MPTPQTKTAAAVKDPPDPTAPNGSAKVAAASTKPAAAAKDLPHATAPNGSAKVAPDAASPKPADAAKDPPTAKAQKPAAEKKAAGDPADKPKSRGKYIVRGLVLLAAIAGIATWWFLTRPAPIPPNIIALSGRIEGDDSAVASKPGGRVLEIRVREGDSVKKGDLIAVMDDAQVRDREQQAQDALQQAESLVQVQQRQIPVLEQQLAQGSLAVAQSQLDTHGKVFQAQQQVTAADANILQAEARVRSARRQIANLQHLVEQNRLGVDEARQDAQGRVAQAVQQVAAVEASLLQAQAQHRQAAVDANRGALLADEGAISRQSAEQSRTNEESLGATVVAAEKQVEAARGAVTVAQANLTNPAVRRAQEASALEQTKGAVDDLAAAQDEVVQMKALREQAAGNLTATGAILTNPAVRASQETGIRDQIAQARATIASAEAAARQARAKLAEAQADRKDLRVLAPFAGAVATRVAEPGEVLAPGATVISLVDLSKVYLRGYIAEGEIGRVKLGQEAQIYLDSALNHPVRAFVSRIDPEASFTPENTYFRSDRVLQVVGVKLQVREGVGYAKPGMPSDGEVLVSGIWPDRSKR